MMDEKPPNDGHRRNSLAPQHNYCGIGLAVGANRLRFTEEFIDRYVVLDSLPTEFLSLRRILVDTVWFSGHTVHGLRSIVKCNGLDSEALIL